MCTGHCTYYPTRLAAVQAQRGGFYWLRPCRRPLVWWLLLVCLAGPIILGIILISFWCHFLDLWASFGDHWALVWDTWARSLLYGGPCVECNDLVSRFWTLRGSPFSSLGVTISFPWVWNDGNPIFCWQPDSRSDFRTKSDQFLRCLGQ